MYLGSNSRTGLLALLAVLFVGCGEQKTAPKAEKANVSQKQAEEAPNNARFRLVPQENLPARINELAFVTEDYRSHRFRELRDRFKLDDVVRGVDGEFDRILALRQWICAHIRIENDNPTKTTFNDAMYILEAAEKGGGFHCAHFRLVQQAVYSAYGYVTRCIGAGDGQQGKWKEGLGRHHGVNEVWVNELGKWVLIDGKYDVHYEKDGVPLSALEMRDEILKDGGASVELAYGPKRERRTEHVAKKETYRWISWELNGNVFSQFPAVCTSSALVLFEDDYSKANTWYRDEAPHWAYDAKFFVKVPYRNWIEWTPNIIASNVRLDGDKIVIRLNSTTPNFRRHLMRRDPTATWEPCEPLQTLDIPDAGLKLEFCSENLAGVIGPVHRIVVAPNLVRSPGASSPGSLSMPSGE